MMKSKHVKENTIRGRYEQQQNTLFLETDNPEKRKKELRDCIDYLEDKFKPLLKDYEVKIL